MKTLKQLEIEGLETDMEYHEERTHSATTVEEYCEAKAMLEIIRDRINEIINQKNNG